VGLNAQGSLRAHLNNQVSIRCALVGAVSASWADSTSLSSLSGVLLTTTGQRVDVDTLSLCRWVGAVVTSDADFAEGGIGFVIVIVTSWALVVRSISAGQTGSRAVVTSTTSFTLGGREETRTSAIEACWARILVGHSSSLWAVVAVIAGGGACPS
jgi:hypothetical protein